MQIPVLKLDTALPTPRHAHSGDGGVDLHSRVDVELAPGERDLVPTGVAVAIPAGYAGLVMPRSGLAVRHGIGIVNSPGLVDSGYRGELMVALMNHGSEAFKVVRGERIAQLLVVAVETQEWIEVERLPESSRGADGFGSTGR